MILKFLLRPLIALTTLAVLLGAAAAQTPPTENTDGFWSGGYEARFPETSGTLKAQFEAIADTARITIEIKAWSSAAISGTCNYIARLDGREGKASFHTEGDLSAHFHGRVYDGTCPATLDFSAERSEPDVLLLRLSGEAADVFEMTEIGLRTVFRPPLPTDARAPVQNLDILGVAPGMSEGDIREALESQGFSLEEDKLSDFGQFTKRNLVFGRNFNAENSPMDRVGVQLSAQADWISEEAFALSIGREVVFAPEDAMTVVNLRAALLDKYGTSAYPATEDRFWTREGVRDTEYTNSRGKQSLPTTNPFTGGNSNERALTTGQGPRLRASADERPVGLGGPERVQLGLTLYDPDPIWDDFWRTWSYGRYLELQEAYEKAETAAGAASPEL